MIKYYPTVPKSSNKIQLRLEMVKYAMKFGVSAAAGEFGTTNVTVRKWRDRFNGTLGSLADRSKAPKRILHNRTFHKQERFHWQKLLLSIIF